MTRSGKSGAWIGIALVGIGIAGCANPAKGEAASVVAAVDRFRRAENDQKPGLLAPLQATTCTDRDVCAAREACLAYATATAEGLLLKRDVQRGLADIERERLDRDAEAARALPMKLEEASRLLDRGRTALEGCDAKVLVLRARFGV